MPVEKNSYTPRLKTRYFTVVVPEMMKRFAWSNRYQVPRLVKVVINIGVSEARENIKVMDLAAEELAALSGQKPQVRRAKKSISNFKVREGMPLGLRVTLRGERMYEFMDRLISIAIPRIRDFQGLDLRKGFDGRGNYNLGLNEQYVFPEISLDKSDKPRGMNITVVTTAGQDDTSRELLVHLGMPFKKAETRNLKSETKG